MPARRGIKISERDVELMRLWRAGYSVPAIAEILGIPDATAKGRCWRLGRAGYLEPRPRGFKPKNIVEATRPETTTRKCLRCDKPFDSEGAHNRICYQCKQSAEWNGNDLAGAYSYGVRAGRKRK